MRHAAGDLWHGDGVGHEGEGGGGLIRLLHLQTVPGDGAAVQPRRRARLQSSHRQVGGVEVGRQSRRRIFAVPPGWNTRVAAVNDAIKEGARGEDDGAGADRFPRARHDADHPVSFQKQPLGRSSHQRQIRRRGQLGLHGLAIKATVDLAARPTNGGALGTVQQTELDARDVGQTPHDPIQGVDLSHQMPLAQAADGRVAGHLADGLQLLRQQDRARARASRRRSRFTAGVAAADDDNVEDDFSRIAHPRHIGQVSAFRQ